MSGAPGVRLRPMTEGDAAAVLALNEDWVHLLAPLDPAGLRRLHDWADRADVIEVDGGFAGFVVTVRSGTSYDSENYAWFAARYPEFYYLDRVVLSPEVRRRGVATAVYDELEQHAQRLAPVFALEVNADPPNEPSLAFHAGRGFVEVGRRGEPGHVVSMRAKPLPA